MSVEFQFDFPRTLAAVTYIASKDVPDLTMYKILKILFLADKHHLVKYGRTLTGDRYAALPDGPVPSRVYNFFSKQVLKRTFSSEGRKIVASLAFDRNLKYPIFRAAVPYDADELSKSDISALDFAINEFWNLDYNQLKAVTHKYPAYKKAWETRPKGHDSVLMNVEDLFEGDPAALAGAKEVMLENDQLTKLFAKRRAV